ncbi:MAG: acetate--CoA ligase [Candidatus Binatia bacterium]
MADAKAIEAILDEQRKFPPAEDFSRRAVIRGDSVYREAAADLEGFWAKLASEKLEWIRPWERVLDWQPPSAKWFVGGKLNVAANCLDRHVAAGRGGRKAYLWLGENDEERILTYADLHREVQRFGNVLKSLGVKKGDRVAIYLGMVPELPIAMLACARIGAVHSVVFGGFSSEALRDRINDAEAKLVVTADGAYRRGTTVPLKQNVDAAVAETPTIERVVVVRRTGEPVSMKAGRDLWWHELTAEADGSCPVEPMDSEDMLYILYTSGTTGKPKGIVHTTAGYLLGVTTTYQWIFDWREDDVWWCAADIGWVTGHSYIVYGPLSTGATSVLYEGTPDYPARDRWWQIVERYKVSLIYMAPTAIRSFMKWGKEWPAKRDLTSLRLLGSVGEPINPEAWIWYRDTIGGGRCPVVDTWWQTETGMIMITPLPGITTLKPGSATRPFPGVEAEIVDERGQPAKSGYLILKKPWPAMARTLYKDPDRFREVYWSRVPNAYFTGDGAKQDGDDDFWLLGRVDDVMNVAGHRISTYEVESALVDHPAVAEAAVIGKAHDLKGQAISAFVTLKEGRTGTPELMSELKEHVAKKISAIARPDDIIFSAELPKTRSGKIMRRLLRDVAEGRALGDTTTLADPAVVASLKNQYEDKEA